MKLAVVGTGVAGLTAAHLLAPRHDLTVYEADARPGGHANTSVVNDHRGKLAIDTGFIVYNDRNYPTFSGLLGELGVATQPAEMGLSIADSSGGFEFAGTARGLFAQRSNLVRPRFLRMLHDQLRFNREVRPMIGRRDTPSVGDFVRDSGYSRWFFERIIVPEISAVWSCDPGAVREFPLGFLAEFLHNHGQLQLTGRPRWRTVVGGSGRYVNAIAEPLGRRLRRSAPVRSIERLPGSGVAIAADGCETEQFDEVVIATHSDQALAMLGSPSEEERSVLGAIAYQPNEAVLHTDASLMPRRRNAWASWNFHLTDGAVPTMSYWMNRLHRLDAERQYFVTLNRTDALDPAKVIDVVRYAHPVMTRAAVAAQRRWGRISGADRIHYCGAYWRWGFHEDGCWSATRACRSLLGAVAEPVAERELAELAA